MVERVAQGREDMRRGNCHPMPLKSYMKTFYGRRFLRYIDTDI